MFGQFAAGFEPPVSRTITPGHTFCETATTAVPYTSIALCTAVVIPYTSISLSTAIVIPYTSISLSQREERWVEGGGTLEVIEKTLKVPKDTRTSAL